MGASNPAADEPAIMIITGARRSGTTLLNQILCSDPRANAQVGECRILTQLLKTYGWLEQNYDNVGKWYFADLAEARDFYREIAEGFLVRARAALGEPGVLVLKAPDFSQILPLTAYALPQARFLVTVRHPCDQIASELDTRARQRARQGEPAEDRPAAIAALAGQYSGRYKRLLAAAAALPGRVLFVRFEDVAERTGAEIARMEAFTGLDLSGYDPKADWQRFANADEIRQMPAYVPQYGSPLDPSRVGRYAASLSPAEITAIEAACSETMRHFGYDAPGAAPAGEQGETRG